jgi:hypothetical protein
VKDERVFACGCRRILNTRKYVTLEEEEKEEEELDEEMLC